MTIFRCFETLGNDYNPSPGRRPSATGAKGAPLEDHVGMGGTELRGKENVSLDVAAQGGVAMSSEQIELSRQRLTKPCARSDKPVLCFVERDKTGFNVIAPTYRLYIEGKGVDGDASGHRFVMSAKKKVINRTRYFTSSTSNKLYRLYFSLTLASTLSII